MADKIKFSKGLSSAMGNVTKTAGQFLLQTDTGNLFVDLSASSRLQIKDSTKLPTSGGTMSGAINMGSKKITSLATPTESTDAATKGYVDTLVSGTIDPDTFATKTDLAGKLDKTGGSNIQNFSLSVNNSLSLVAQNEILLASDDANITFDTSGGNGGITATNTNFFHIPTPNTSDDTASAVNINYLSQNFGSVDGIDDGELA